MQDSPLISGSELAALQRSGTPLVLLDCGFDLADPLAGERAWAAGHIPGAAYAHLDRDLAGRPNGRNGRHPLPEPADWAARVGRWGIAPGVRVVTYDAQGSPYAARAWWLLRWLGHDAAAVLDGGVAAWRAAGGALTTEVAAVAARPPYPAPAGALPAITVDALLERRADLRILDARAAERYRGDTEPLDAAAGHIPGAVSRFFKLNLEPDGRFKPAATLRAEFEPLVAGATTVVQQCGSGVTACHNLLAMVHAGLGMTTLYPGSWSEWSSDPSRPVARGD
ncbi:MAG: sulfurtransferase [Burkholderiales bacterium]|nr:sulfurtransferase [Burkholderiales bacterium]